MYTLSLMGLINNKAHSNSWLHKPNTMQRKCKKERTQQYPFFNQTTFLIIGFLPYFFMKISSSWVFMK